MFEIKLTLPHRSLSGTVTSYVSVHLSVGYLVGRSVCHNFLNESILLLEHLLVPG